MQTLPTLIADYLDSCKYEKKLSVDTIKAYSIDLQQFSDFAGDSWQEKETILKYIKHLNQSFAPRSAKRKLASIRAFYHDLEFNEILGINPFNKLHIHVQFPTQLPRVIPIQVVHDLLQSAYEAYSDANRETLRDIVVLELLFSTGLRVSELCA